MRLEPDIDSASIFAEVLGAKATAGSPKFVRGLQATLSLASIGLTANPMSDLYEGIDLPDPIAAMP
jgi:hypothetical protein